MSGIDLKVIPVRYFVLKFFGQSLVLFDSPVDFSGEAIDAKDHIGFGSAGQSADLSLWLAGASAGAIIVLHQTISPPAG